MRVMPFRTGESVTIPSLAPSTHRIIRAGSHHARTILAPTRTIVMVRGLAPLAPVPIRAPCGANPKDLAVVSSDGTECTPIFAILSIKGGD